MGRAHFYWGCAVGIVLGVVLRSALPLDESVPRFTEERSLVGGGSASTPLRFVPPQPRSVAAAGSSAAPLVRLATLDLNGLAVTGGRDLDALKAIQAKLTPAAAGSSI